MSFARIALLFACIFPSLVQAQMHVRSLSGSGPHIVRSDLKGRVRKVTQVQSPLSHKEEDFLDGHSGQNYTKSYTKQGLLQTYTSRDDHNQAQSITHYDYNSQNQLTSIRTKEIKQNPIWGHMVDGQVEYRYDPAKNLVVVLDNRIVMGKPVNGRKELLTDSLNKTFVEREYKRDTLIREQQYSWDKHGYVVEQISRFRRQAPEIMQLDTAALKRFIGNDLPQVDKAELDSAFKVIQAEQISSFANSPLWREDTVNYHNQYDADGKLLEQESRPRKGGYERVRFQYKPESTEVIRQSYNPAGDLISETIDIQHPIDHHIISSRRRHKAGDKWSELNIIPKDMHQLNYRYLYDRHGNWVEQKQVDASGKQIGVTLVRTIEYYP